MPQASNHICTSMLNVRQKARAISRPTSQSPTSVDYFMAAIFFNPRISNFQKGFQNLSS
jgi:hypothetical protein